jgi:hypothetical protein
MVARERERSRTHALELQLHKEQAPVFRFKAEDWSLLFLHSLPTYCPYGRSIADHPASAAPDRNRAENRKSIANSTGGSAMAQRSAIQQRTRRRHYAWISRSGSYAYSALSRSSALRSSHTRAARVSTTRTRLRVDRSSRSRRLCVSRKDRMGLGRPLARPGTSWSEAALQDSAGTRVELLRGLRRSLGTNQGLLRARPSRPRSLRLAAVRWKSVEGRTAAARLAASPDQVFRSPVSNQAQTLRRIHQEERLQTMEAFQGSRALESTSRGVQKSRLIGLTSALIVANPLKQPHIRA